ncbi:hypothetical protein ACA910_014559 [Epithemia clementina (nom. ined.)]
MYLGAYLVAFWLLFLAATRLTIACATDFDEDQFDRIINKIEEDVHDLARELERLYPSRCEPDVISSCSNANYDHCLSSFPKSTCPGGKNFHNPACGNGAICSATYSFEVTTVALLDELTDGRDRNPSDPRLVEAVCFSKKLDEFFLRKRSDDAAFWRTFGYEPTAMYFGSRTGAFRIFPARHFQKCGLYDPLVRPWYVAASSGPKNVILVLDTSRTMNKNTKIGLLKKAASRVVGTLSTGDRVAIVPFSDEAFDITDSEGYMATANNKSIHQLLDRIDGLTAGGEANYWDAFKKAFDILDASFQDGELENCNTAILFLTDGQMTAPPDKTEEDVIQMVESRLLQSQTALKGYPIHLLTFSIPDGDSKIDEFPSRLACSVPNGVWAKIRHDRGMIDSLSSYYKLFALALGAEENMNFTAWVEPYRFASIDVLGTTASVPVYDRSKKPPFFLGVVGVDLVIPALNAALGITDGSSDEAIQRVVNRSTAYCPKIELGKCLLESYRRESSAGDEAFCPNNTDCLESDFVKIEEQKCSTDQDYPDTVWANVDMINHTYFEAACCGLGSSGGRDMTCRTNADSMMSEAMAIALGACIGAVVGLFVAVLALVFYRRTRLIPASNSVATAASSEESSHPFGMEESIGHSPSPVAGDMQVEPLGESGDPRPNDPEDAQEQDRPDAAGVKAATQ